MGMAAFAVFKLFYYDKLLAYLPSAIQKEGKSVAVTNLLQFFTNANLRKNHHE